MTSLSFHGSLAQRSVPVLKVLANDKGSNLTIQALKDLNSVNGTVFIPAGNKKVIVYRWGLLSYAAGRQLVGMAIAVQCYGLMMQPAVSRLCHVHVTLQPEQQQCTA
jgi:hypothetical protein